MVETSTQRYSKAWYKRNRIRLRAVRHRHYLNNREAYREKDRRWRKLNPNRSRELGRIFYRLHRRKLIERKRKWKIQHWNNGYRFSRLLSSIKSRCTNPNASGFKNYGGRGILCELSSQDIRELWERDAACKMIKPTIDRINNDGHYSFSNCRFIELVDNLKKSQREHPRKLSHGSMRLLP